jgi:cellulose synthase/poly-beta-1,6-N-acetylglucosamine synthase-like glycosyltransferase
VQRLPYIVFWVSVALLLYVYVGYPVLIRAWARLRPRTVHRDTIEPRVSVLLAAHDEGHRIAERIANLASLDYPAERIEILIGSDGSTDDTVARARAEAGPTIRVFEFPNRRGKAAVLNDLARHARGEILVMADARQRFDPGAVRGLVRAFADPEVGAVSGELILTEDGTAAAAGGGVGFYWRYEKLIRRSESEVDSIVGATGAIYAIRRDLFEPLPPDTVLDDVLCPLRIVRRGKRVVFEPRARAYDRVAASAEEEFARKVRTIAGNFQLLASQPWLLDPRANRLWFQTVSHKGLRLLSPLLLLAAFTASIPLVAEHAVYATALAGQGVMYALAGAGAAVRNQHLKVRMLIVPFTFCMMNWATIVALTRLARGGQSVAWDKATALGEARAITGPGV